MKISTGKMYLFIERVPLRTHQVLRKELSEGRKALYISKNSPHLLRTQLNFDSQMIQMKWLTPRPGHECIPPMNLAEFEKYVNRCLIENKNGIVVLNGVEVLEKWNGFKPVLEVIKRAQEKISSNGNNLLISLDPKTQFSKNLSDLEKISDEVVSSYA
ncbi:MAG: DUF835 domain-containing protein [Methanomassiliicoccales archaeon]|nr:DUF835 domain-containing protein [Methanomassiliicoccales archaeon]